MQKRRVRFCQKESETPEGARAAELRSVDGRSARARANPRAGAVAAAAFILQGIYQCRGRECDGIGGPPRARARG